MEVFFRKNKIMDFKSIVVDRKLCSIIIDVEVSENIMTDEIEIVFNRLQRQIKINGFREGKVPIDIIKRKYSNEAKNEAIENIIKKTFLEALKKESFVPIGFPVIEEFNYKFGQILKYRFTAECHPKIEIKNYRDIPIVRKTFEITEKSLLLGLDVLREKNAILVPSKSSKITEKSFVLIDYNAFDDNGKPFPEINMKGYMLDLNSKNIANEFKEALKGAKIGDEKNIRVVYSEDYPNKSLKGKSITFKTKIIEIKEKELPELSDCFAKNLGAENLEDLKAKIKKAMEYEEKYHQDIDVKNQFIEYLLEKNVFDVPLSMITKQKKDLISRMKNYMQNQHASEEYIKNQIELKDLELKKEAEKNIRISYILNTIYTTEKLIVTDTDIGTKKNNVEIFNSRDINVVDKRFTDKQNDAMFLLREQKLFEFLLKNANIKEEKKISI
jgi:trigger factor